MTKVKKFNILLVLVVILFIAMPTVVSQSKNVSADTYKNSRNSVVSSPMPESNYSYFNSLKVYSTLSLSNNTLYKGIYDGAGGYEPTYSAYNQLNKYLYLISSNNGYVTVYNTSSKTTIKMLNIMYRNYSNTYSDNIVFDPFNDMIYVTASSYNTYGTSYIAEINASNNTINGFYPLPDSFPYYTVVANNKTLYIANTTQNGGIIVFNTSSNKISKTIPFAYPEYISYNPKDDILYVSGENGNNNLTVSEINTYNNTIVGNISLKANYYPTSMAYDEQNKNLYISAYPSNISSNRNEKIADTLYIINTIDNNISNISLHLGTSIQNMVFDQYNGLVYLSNYQTSTIYTINGTTISNISLPSNYYPYGISIVNGQSFIVDYGINAITAINATTILYTVNLAYAPICMNEVNNYVYVLNSFSSNISIINTTTNRVIGGISLPFDAMPTNMTYDPANKNLYVISGYKNTMYIINTLTGHINNTIPLPLESNPVSLLITNTTLYILDGNYNISIFNITTNKIVNNIPLPIDFYSFLNFRVNSSVVGMTYDQYNSLLYVLENGVNSSIVIVNTTNNMVTKNLYLYGYDMIDPSAITFNPQNKDLYIYGEILSPYTIEGNGVLSIGTYNYNITDTYVMSTYQYTPDSVSQLVYNINNKAMLSIYNETSIDIVNISQKMEQNEIQVGIMPVYILLLKNEVYVSNMISNTITILVPAKTPVYNVSFISVGLSSKYQNDWFVEIHNNYNTITLTKNNSFSFLSFNNTYYFSVYITSAIVANPSPSYGMINVSGHNTIQYIFFKHQYQVIFIESGISNISLQYGYSWSVNIFNVNTQISVYNSSTTQYANFSLPNGTYSYVVTPPINYRTPNIQGMFNVTNSSITIHIKFLLNLYKISFVESGLPQYMPWNINITDYSSYGISYINETSYNNTATFLLVNGTYSYEISSIKGMVATPPYSEFGVYGLNISININFHLSANYFLINFSESGLKATIWGIKLNNTVVTSTYPNIYYIVTNGQYAYTVNPLKGYSINPQNGTIIVNGKNVSIKIYFTAISPTHNISHNITSSSNVSYVSTAVVVLSIIGVIEVALIISIGALRYEENKKHIKTKNKNETNNKSNTKKGSKN
ncbi:MAG: YncE family protein [Thermoplasmata archaeon]